MTDRQPAQSNPDEPHIYRIRMRGRLGPEWTAWFEGMSLTWDEAGDTLLTGPVTDQAALHGLLRRVRDLGVPLISVERLPSDSESDEQTGAGG